MNIVEQGSGSIRNIGSVYFSIREFPDQPAVDGTEAKFTTLGFISCAFHVVEYPFQLCAGKIGIGDQAGFAADHFSRSIFF